MVNSELKRNTRKEKTGIVLSNKMQKTIVVQVCRKARHPLYGKVIEKATKFKVHDEKNQAQIGDRVSIMETRPVSKQKRWRLVEILNHAKRKVSAGDEIKDALEEITPRRAPSTAAAQSTSASHSDGAAAK